MNSRELLSITLVSAIVGRSSRTVRLWADQGKLTVFRGPGRRRYFLREEVEALRSEMLRDGAAASRAGDMP